MPPSALLRVPGACAASSLPRRAWGARASSSRSLCAGAAAGEGAGGGDDQAVVTVEFRGKRIQVPKGARLRTALLLNALTPHNAQTKLINCRGIGSCGTCSVRVEGEVLPAEWTTAERIRLGLPPHSPPNNERLRLACQITCESDLSVTKMSKLWGQGGEEAEDEARGKFAAPLGMGTELILDGDEAMVERCKELAARGGE